MVFVDTNVWGYAFIGQDSAKQRTAAEIVRRAVSEDSFAISTQVVSELINILFKKSPLSPQQILDCSACMRCVGTIVPVTLDIARRAVEIKALYGLQFYDAQIVAAAEKCGCDELWSEDMGGGATYCGVRCVNPFEK